MNSFDKNFFKKFIPENQKLVHIIHIHPIVIFKRLLVQILLLVLLPVFAFHISPTINSFVPFIYFEIYLFLIYAKIIYDIFDWYNDVWIITDSSVVALDWTLLKTKTESVGFDNIEWLWVEINWIFDKLLRKWDLVIHKIWDEEFILQDSENPYKAINIIEDLSDWAVKDDSFSNEKFNQLIDALNWVMWTNISKQNDYVDLAREKAKKEALKQAENSEWVIDLR